MRAHLSRNSTYTVALLIFVTLTLWLFRHVYNLVSNAYNVEANGLHWAYLFTFGILFVSLAIAHREKPIEGEVTDDYVTVIIPAYNEDPKLLKNCLKSLINQSRKPNKIFLVDDGSNAESYASVKRWFIKTAKKHKIEARWVKKENGGKRSAQAVAIKRTPKTAIYVTVDSDSVLDKYAIEEGLKPFSNPEIMSVAGLVLALNNQTNFLARFTDLMFVSGQLVDRSMMSAIGSVNIVYLKLNS
jgi:hyaluronan synthase